MATVTDTAAQERWEKETAAAPTRKSVAAAEKNSHKEKSPKSADALSTTEGAIWTRIVKPEAEGLSREAAKTLLELDFSPSDRERMDELAEKARAGALTARERKDAETYNRVAHVLALLQSKARQSLGARKHR